MSGHTSGPWAVELDRANDGDIEIVVDEGWPGLEKVVALLDCRDVAEDTLSPWRDEALANARLIAAAPDLLKAAKHFGACEFTGQSIEFRCPDCVAGREAIAKAEGR